MDATPLPKPVNAFRFVRATLRMEIDALRRLPAGPQREQALAAAGRMLTQLDPWLEHLQRRVAYETAQPILAAALGELARNGAERKRFLDALHQVDELTQAALAAQPASPPAAATEPTPS